MKPPWEQDWWVHEWENCLVCTPYKDCPKHDMAAIEADYYKQLKELACKYIDQGPGFGPTEQVDLLKQLADNGLTPTGRPNVERRPRLQQIRPDKERKIIVGIDPGYTAGAMAVYEYDGEAASATYMGANNHVTWADRDADPMETLPPYLKADIEATMRVYNIFTGSAHVSMPTAEQIRRWNSNKAVQAVTSVLREEQIEMNRIDVVDAEIRRLQRERAILARFPKDNFPAGSVIKFERVFGGSWEELKDVDSTVKYEYVAIKIERQNGHPSNPFSGPINSWYLAGQAVGWQLSGDHPKTPQNVSWAKLTEWLGDSVGEMWLMVPAADLLSPGTAPTPFISPVVVTTTPAEEAPTDLHGEQADQMKHEDATPDPGWYDETTGLTSGPLPGHKDDLTDVAPGEPAHTQDKWQ